MIRFALRCADDHSFESWFQSSKAFDSLQAAGMVTCPQCQSAEITKDLMAPPVRSSKKAAKAPAEPFPTDPPAQPMSNNPDPKIAEAIKAIRSHVEKNSDYVGDSFASEARAMHEGDTPHRAIHGEAKLEDAKKLIDDGVPALPLPFIPRQKTN